MLAVMVACPAFGEVSTYCIHAGHTNELCGEISEGQSSADCGADPLTFESQSPNYGTYTLTAQWEVDECPITLDKNGGTTDSVPTTLYARYNSGAYLESTHTNLMTTSSNSLTTAPVGPQVTMTVHGNEPGLTDITTASTNNRPFTGFYSTSAATGNPYIGNDKLITSDGDTAAKSITKNASGVCDPTTWYAGWGCYTESQPVSPTNAYGYTFDGWYDAASGGNAVSNWCISSDTNVYAHWVCNITYNATTHSVNPSATASNTATYSSVYNMPSVNSVMAAADGYTFVGWTTDSTPTVTRTGDTTGTVADPWTWTDGTTWTETVCPTNIYAAYIANRYTVTYDCNGGTIADSTLVGSSTSSTGTDTVIYGDQYNFVTQNSLCSYSNKTPSGWSCNISGTPWYTAQNWNVTNNVTCIAQWDSTAYTITYDCGSLPNNGGTVNGGTFETGNSNVDTVYNGTQNYQVKSSATGCGTGTQLDGYHFTGWTCTPNLATGSSSATYSVNWPTATTVSQTIATIGISGNATCEAQWEANVVYLQWIDDNDPNSGDTSSNGQGNSCNYGPGQIPLPSQNPTKAGHTFTGWKVTYWDEGVPGSVLGEYGNAEPGEEGH